MLEHQGQADPEGSFSSVSPSTFYLSSLSSHLSLPSLLIKPFFLLGCLSLSGLLFDLKAPPLSLSMLATVGTIVHLNSVPSMVLFVCLFDCIFKFFHMLKKS